MTTAHAGLERNLRLYGWYLPLSRSYFWAPIFFLFFSARFSISELLQLQSLYYATVVALEVPSGYLSDRVSRTATLRLAALAQVVAYTLFVFGGTSYALFAAAQIVQAVSFSFASGTDTSFHYDTLTGLGRESEFAPREARINSRALLATGTSAVLGGGVAFFELRWAYVLSLFVAVIAFAVVAAMREPPRKPVPQNHGFARQLSACLGYLQNPLLAWILAYTILQTTLEHIPYEFVQPYLAVVLGESVREVQNTPIASGLVTAAIAFVAAYAASRSVSLRDRFGLGRVLLATTALQTAIIALMGVVFHALVIPVLLLRSCYPAIGRVLINTAVAPRVPQLQRATYLSLHSLAGRLGYAVVLYGLSGVGAGATNDPHTLATMLRACTALAFIGLAGLALSRGALRRDSQPK